MQNELGLVICGLMSKSPDSIDCTRSDGILCDEPHQKSWNISYLCFNFRSSSVGPPFGFCLQPRQGFL